MPPIFFKKLASVKIRLFGFFFIVYLFKNRTQKIFLMIFEVDIHSTLMLSILVFFIGQVLTKNLRFLDRYNIPAPVSGGLLFALIALAVFLIFDIRLTFDMGLRDELLIIFFTCIGLQSKVAILRKGGKAILVLAVIVFVCLFFQDALGGMVAKLLGEQVELGVLAGSISLSGGHGTAIAWSEVLSEEYGVQNAQEIGVSCATLGLIFGGVLGTPLARRLILRNRLASFKGDKENREEVRKSVNRITANSFLRVLLMVSIAIIIGEGLQMLFSQLGLLVPAFVCCLFGGIIVINIRGIFIKNEDNESNGNTLVLISSVSLNVFLSMSLMSLQLWVLKDLAGPVLGILVVQVFIVLFFARFVVFKLLGKDYDAALISGGFVGMSLGATPTAITNIDALEQKYGYSPKAMVVVPIIGAFFIDILNVVVITSFLKLFG